MKINKKPLRVGIVGAGPAGLAAAYHLAQLNANSDKKRELSIAVLEKGKEIGSHGISGAVMEPRGISELMPDWLERGCPDHGLVRTLYDESPEILRYLEKWQAPTKQHVPDQAENDRQVPEAYAFGLPAMQTQHTCILLEDILDHCRGPGSHVRGCWVVDLVLIPVPVCPMRNRHSAGHQAAKRRNRAAESVLCTRRIGQSGRVILGVLRRDCEVDQKMTGAGFLEPRQPLCWVRSKPDQP